MDTTESASHPFRDGTAGSEAKRRKLLSDRRDDLATMSHEIRKVYINRVSRLAATLMLSLGGAVILLASLRSDIAEGITRLLPGNAPAALSSLLVITWILGGFAYLLGRSLAEHRFTVAMSKAVLPTQDLHVDVARLEFEAPDAVARRLVRRRESLSRLSPVLAVGLIGPASILAAAFVVEAGGYPLVDDVELLLTKCAPHLLVLAGMTTAIAVCMGLRPNWRPGRLAALSFLLAMPASFASGFALLPALIAGGLIAAGVAAISQRRHARQNARIEQEGAPLPASFSLRKRISRLWSALAAVPRFFRPSNLKARALRVLRFRPSRSHVYSVALVVAGASALTLTLSTSSGQANVGAGEVQAAQAPPIALHTPPVPVLVAAGNQGSASRVDHEGSGVVFHFRFDRQQPVDASSLLGGAVIPHGWRAIIKVQLRDSGSVFVETLPKEAYASTPRQLSSSTPDVEFDQTNCTGSAMPLLLKVAPYGDRGGAISTGSLQYEVQLEMVSTCSTEY